MFMVPLLPFWVLTNLENSSFIPEVETIRKENSREWQGYSVALHILLPVAGFCILWGRRELFSRLMLQLDRSCISVFCPSISQREKLLQWASENLPTTWSSPSKTLSGGLSDLWKDGSLLCTLINMAIPGACSNPPKHWRKTPTHAQALAYKYFGIIPVFTEKDFNASLNPAQERKFLIYLQEVQRAIKKYNSEEPQPQTLSNHYLTKGMGLQTGEQYKKNFFYVYSNTTNSDCHNIMVHIKGPFQTQGAVTIPAFHNLDSSPLNHLMQKKVRGNDKITLKKEPRRSFLKSIALDFKSIVNLEKRTQNNDIPIHIEIENDRVKVTYIPNHNGVYEISLVTNGEILTGSPFLVNITENVLEAKEDFENAGQVLHDLIPSIKKKKIVSRFIDCINERIEIKYPQKNSIEAKNKCMEKESLSTSKKQNNYLNDQEDPEDTTNVIRRLKGITEDSEEVDTSKKIEKDDCNKLLIPTLSLTEATDDDSSSPETEVSSLQVRKMSTTPKIVESFPKTSTFRRNPKFSTVFAQGINKIRPNTSSNRTEVEEIEELTALTTETGVEVVEAKRTMFPNRPTSVVLPFLKSKETVVSSLKNNSNDQASSESKDKLISIFNQKKSKALLTKEKKITESEEAINEQPIKFETRPSEDDQVKDSENKTLDSLEYEIKEFEPEELLRSLRYNKSSIKNTYVDSLKAILNNQMRLKSENAKEIKDLVNTSNKLAELNNKLTEKSSMSQDQNNNNASSAISSSNESKYADGTSPICKSHIVKEVEQSTFRKMSLVEKRKALVKQPTCLSTSSSSSSVNHSSFSDKEKEKVEGHLDNQKCNSMKVLTVLETLKRSSTLCRSSSNSMSVPDVSEIEETKSKTSTSLSTEGSEDSQSYFVKTRDYWKNLSLSNVATASDSDSDRSYWQSPSRKLPNQIQERLKFKPDIYRSVDDIFSMSRRSFEKKKMQRYSSLNQKDLEMMELISIDERKKKLLQDRYEKENLGSRFIKRSLYKAKEKLEAEEEGRCQAEENGSLADTKTNSMGNQRSQQFEGVRSEFNKPRANSQFKKAITFFKNLERSPPIKKKQTELPKTSNKKPSELRRRLSLDFEKKKKGLSKMGGSLRIPKTWDKFSVTQIYLDIMGNKRGSFRGAANKNALTETLSSLAKEKKSKNGEEQSENNIDLDMFVAKLKTKKRRSIKSIFDVQY